MKAWRGHLDTSGRMTRVVSESDAIRRSNCTVVPDGEEMPLSYNNKRLIRIAKLTLHLYAAKGKLPAIALLSRESAVAKACEAYLQKNPKPKRTH